MDVDAANLMAVFNQTETALIITNVESEILFLNRQAEIFGFLTNLPLQIGQALLNVIPSQWRDIAPGFKDDLVASGTRALFDASLPDLEGKNIHFELKFYTVVDPASHAIQIVIEGRNVTQQKIAEKEISTIATARKNLIENANAAIIGLDSSGYVTDWNEASSVTTGYSKNESLSKKFSDLLLGDGNRKAFFIAFNGVLKGNPISNYVLPVRTKEDHKLVLLISAAPRKNRQGQIIGVVLVCQNISELTESRKMLEQKINDHSEELRKVLKKEKELIDIKNHFIAIASHELRAPLKSINFIVESMTQNIKKLSAVRSVSSLQGIQAQINYMDKLLDDVLLIEKSNTGLQPIISLVDLKAFFHKIIGDVRSEMNDTYAIELDSPDPVPQIESDEELLRIIIINLLNNAIKFSPGKEKVFVTVSTLTSAIEIKVKDEGIGIDEKDINRIFEPFHRGSNVAEIKGTGLGLSIVKKAVEALGGNLSVESQLQKGSVFTIRFNSSYGQGHKAAHLSEPGLMD